MHEIPTHTSASITQCLMGASQSGFGDSGGLSGREMDDDDLVFVPGLQNAGNTCFANAVLQALAAVPQFHAHLERIVRCSGNPKQTKALDPLCRALGGTGAESLQDARDAELQALAGDASVASAGSARDQVDSAARVRLAGKLLVLLRLLSRASPAAATPQSSTGLRDDFTRMFRIHGESGLSGDQQDAHEMLVLLESALARDADDREDFAASALVERAQTGNIDGPFPTPGAPGSKTVPLHGSAARVIALSTLELAATHSGSVVDPSLPRVDVPPSGSGTGDASGAGLESPATDAAAMAVFPLRVSPSLARQGRRRRYTGSETVSEAATPPRCASPAAEAAGEQWGGGASLEGGAGGPTAGGGPRTPVRRDSSRGSSTQGTATLSDASRSPAGSAAPTTAAAAASATRARSVRLAMLFAASDSAALRSLVAHSGDRLRADPSGASLRAALCRAIAAARGASGLDLTPLLLNPSSVADLLAGAGQARLRSPLRGATASSIRCLGCRSYSTWQLHPFTVLSLPLAGGSLATCLARQICDERISEEYRCDRCGGTFAAVRRSRLVRLPPVLAVHLQRQTVGPLGPAKDPAHIAFPFRLDATPLCANTRPPAPPGVATSAGLAPPPPSEGSSAVPAPHHKVSYTLMSVVEHMGGAYGGHYIAYRRIPRPKRVEAASEPEGKSWRRLGTGRWVMASDERVKPVTSEIVKRCQAYMLLYARSDPRADPSGGSKGIARDEGLDYWDVSGGGHRLTYTYQ